MTYLQLLNLPQVTDNRITLFYFFDTPIELAGLKSEIFDNLDLPSSFKHGLDNRLGNQPFWQLFNFTINPDITEPVRALFSGEKGAKAVNTWRLNPIVVRAINSSGNQADHFLSLHFSNAAKERLKDLSDKQILAELLLEQVLCHQFNTGFSVVTVELTVACAGELSHRLLNEVVYALARFNQLIYRDRRTEESQQSKFSMGQLVRTLLGSDASLAYQRVYSHVYVQFKGETICDDTIKYLSKLARHYNDEYQLNDTLSGVKLIQDYTNIAHAVCSEGSASCVALSNTSDAPNFLCNYKTASIAPVHIPIHLFVFHAEQAMQRFYFPHSVALGKANEEILEQLEEFQVYLLDFEFNFFHTSISHISSHNHIFKSLLEVKNLQSLHSQLKNNTHLLSQIILDLRQKAQAQEQERKNVSYCKIAQIGVAAAAYMSSSSIIAELQTFVLSYFDENSHWAKLLHHNSAFFSLPLSFGIAAVVFWFARRQCLLASSHKGHGPAEYASHIAHILHYRHGNKSH